MKKSSKPKVYFPRWESYNVAVEHIIRNGLDCDYLYAKPITRRTLELGTKNSPDFVCTPFKYILGGYIEAIEEGANTLIQVGGLCRLGYYGELHEQILRDLGYKDINFVNMANASFKNPLSFYDEFKKINPDLSLKKVTEACLVAVKMVEIIDKVEDYIRQNVGFEVVEGSFDKLHQEFLDDLRDVEDKKELNVLYKLYKKKFKKIEVNKPKIPLKVGFVGEYYTIMDGYSNHYMEKELAKKGIVIYRWMNLSNSILNPQTKEVKQSIKNYAKYDMGATAMYTIKKALDYAKDGVDGIIHVKSFGCTPEIDTMPVLQRISEDYKIPVIYFSFDSQTSDVGINTRVEAFYDMIMMRKEQKK